MSLWDLQPLGLAAEDDTLWLADRQRNPYKDRTTSSRPLGSPTGLDLPPSLMAGDFCGDERTRTADPLLAKQHGVSFVCWPNTYSDVADAFADLVPEELRPLL
jgi:hypothetical protein